MTVSTAKLAQGASLSIAGTPGSSLSITAITKAAGAVCSCTSPPTVGTIVVFATAAGMPEIVGRVGEVTSISAGVSFTVNIDSSSFATAATTSTATPQTWTKVANVKDINALTGTVSKIDVTNLDSAAMEYVPGLEDFGGLSGSFDLNGTDAGQIALAKAKTGQTSTYFKLNYPAASITRAFAGFVTKLDEASSVNNVLRQTFEVQITGRASRTEVVA
jgi:hypothetical protein